MKNISKKTIIRLIDPTIIRFKLFNKWYCFKNFNSF